MTRQAIQDARCTAGQVADTLVVADAGSAGYPAANIDGNTRAALIGRGWLVALRTTSGPTGSTAAAVEVGPREWAAHLWVTPAGLAGARNAAALPVQLGTRDAFALAEIEAEIEAEGPGPGGGLTGFWPGTDQALRVARRWRLIDFTPRSPTSGGWGRWTLTGAGAAALQRWRAQLLRPNVPTPGQARVLDCVARLGITASHAAAATYMCLEFGWIGRAPGSRPLAITVTGRAALARYTATPATAPRRPPRPRPTLVRDLTAGAVCRLAHRSGWRNLTPDWVTFKRAEKVLPRPGGWRVWVDDGAGGERPYVDGLISYQAKFEVKPA